MVHGLRNDGREPDGTGRHGMRFKQDRNRLFPSPGGDEQCRDSLALRAGVQPRVARRSGKESGCRCPSTRKLNQWIPVDLPSVQGILFSTNVSVETIVHWFLETIWPDNISSQDL